MNYYFHCKRQCYLHGNRLNLEDNSEQVHIGKAVHKLREDKENAEIAVDNIRIDKITNEYLTEVKMSDADVEAAKWQLIYYLSVLSSKGIKRKGKLEFIEKNKQDRKVIYVELSEELKEELHRYIAEIEELILGDVIPECLDKPKCKKCAYFEYCYI